MSVVSFRIDEELKRKMKRKKYVNWSEVVRGAIEERIELEDSLSLQKRTKDFHAISEAVRSIEGVRNKTIHGRWSGAEEIRKWRDQRRR